MKHAWDNYVKYAWGKNELKPISKRSHSGGIFGNMQWGGTIVDGLDTLYIMGLEDEYKMGRNWIANELDMDNMVRLHVTFSLLLTTCYLCSCVSVVNT